MQTQLRNFTSARRYFSEIPSQWPGTLSARTERLVGTYLTELQIDLHPDGVLFRARTGNAYGRDTLAHDFDSRTVVTKEAGTAPVRRITRRTVVRVGLNYQFHCDLITAFAKESDS